MYTSLGRDDVRGWVVDTLRRTARWAWERDEVDETITKEKIGYRVVLYGLLSVLSFAIGGVLWLNGHAVPAIGVWIVWNGFTAFFGVIAIGWDVLEFVDTQRDGDEERSSGASAPELAPDLTIPRDAKISFIVTVTVLLLMTLTVYTAMLIS